MGQFGLRLDDLEFWWRLGYGQLTDSEGDPCPDTYTSAQYREAGLRNVVEIERQYPGGAKLLSIHNRIRNFGRAPLSLLLSQRPPKKFPYKKALFGAVAVGDYNGALLDSLFCLEQMRQQLPDDIGVVLTEFEDSQDIEESWGEYGNAGVRAAAFMLMGHGDENSIMAYEHRDARAVVRQNIERKHVAGPLGDLMCQLALPGAVTLFDSCCTGRGDDNIARTSFERTGLYTIAPKDMITTEFIRVNTNSQGHLAITPGFYVPHKQGKKVLLKRSAARHYRPQMRADELELAA